MRAGLLALNDEAVQAVQGSGLEHGWIRFGMQEDFGESLLPAILGQFSRAHPQFRLDVKVARNQQLLDGLTKGELDLVLAWDGGQSWPYQEDGDTTAVLDRQQANPVEYPPVSTIPLVAFEAPCLMRARLVPRWSRLILLGGRRFVAVA
jgi:DNA-binding transcriptional LysR family regulator